jgi:uncharacterized membrane protein (Fun14 family)
MINDEKTAIYKYFIFYLKIIVFIVFVFSLSLFWLSFHSIDISFNAFRLDKEFGNFTDTHIECSLSKRCITYVEVYEEGLINLILSFFLFGISLFFLAKLEVLNFGSFKIKKNKKHEKTYY